MELRRHWRIERFLHVLSSAQFEYLEAAAQQLTKETLRSSDLRDLVEQMLQKDKTTLESLQKVGLTGSLLQGYLGNELSQWLLLCLGPLPSDLSVKEWEQSLGENGLSALYGTVQLYWQKVANLP